jgi:hypothetical protein
VLRTPDAAVRTSLTHVYYPWQVFQKRLLQSPDGPLHQGSATPRCPEHQVFPRPGATVSQARWRELIPKMPGAQLADGVVSEGVAS